MLRSNIAPARIASLRRIAAAGPLVVVLAIALLVAACAGSDAPLVSFDPTGPCTSDGQQPGAYPELEALLPDAFEDERPSNVDSGRTCSATALGTLAAAGVTEVRFAGATWRLGGTSGMTLAVFRAAGLDATMMRDFYQSGAQAARRTEKLQASDMPVGNVVGKRLDVLGSDGTGQTVVAWPGADGLVWVLLAADMGDASVAAAVDAFGSR